MVDTNLLGVILSISIPMWSDIIVQSFGGSIENAKGDLLAMNQYVWLAPFVYLGVVLSLYLSAPSLKKPDVQKRMKTQINTLLGLALVMVVLAVTAYMQAYGGPRTGPTTLAWVTWIALVATLIFAATISFSAEPPAPPSAFENQKKDPL